MIHVKSEKEIEFIREACRIVRDTLNFVGEKIHAGMTTKELDELIERFIRSEGANPSCLGYGGFPASACISINEVVVHGLPGDRVIQDGDIVSVDVGAYIGGFHGDCAATFPCGRISPEAEDLIRVTRESFFEGIKLAKEGHRLMDISAAIQMYVESRGYSIVREFVGHGIGTHLHESPEVPNYGRPGRGPRLLRGMTLAIEPMVNAGEAGVMQLSDGWTVKTLDGKLSAHYENTVLITDGEPEILTAPAI